MTIRSSLVVQGTKPELTSNRECDARTALMRGLGEYLAGTTTTAQGGRVIKLLRVYEVWAEPEDEAVYPSAIINSGDAVYDASSFTPGIDTKEQLPAPDGRYVSKIAEMAMDITVELWCTDPVERAELVAALEEKLVPYDSMYGLLLNIPHYYGVRAAYEMRSVRYIDSEDDAMKRYRRAVFTLSAQMPVVRLRAISLAKPRAILEVTDQPVVSTIQTT